MRKQNVGIAPGTTTLHCGPTGDFGAIPSAMQMSIESGASPMFQPAGSPLTIQPQLAGLGTVRPTDFDKAKIYGYLPLTTGWLPGRLTTLSDGEPEPGPGPAPVVAPSGWRAIGTVEKGAVVAGSAMTALGAVLALLDHRRYGKIALGLGATGGTILLGYAGAHMAKSRAMLADPNTDVATAPALFAKESAAEGFDLLAGTIVLSGVITGLMMLGPTAA